MPETRLIDGAELKEHIESTICYGCQIGHMVPPCGKCYVSIVLRYIDEMPTIDEQPIIHAHWIMLDERVGQCSNCGYCQKSNGIDKTGHGNIHKAVYKWCTVCGATMDGGDAK